MSMIDSVEKTMNNLSYLKQIYSKYKDNIGLKGSYYTDLDLVLKDYLIVKEQLLALLQSSGQDNDTITLLTAENNKLNREVVILRKEKQDYTEQLDLLYNLVISNNQ